MEIGKAGGAHARVTFAARLRRTCRAWQLFFFFAPSKFFLMFAE
jgi:hypothetical protein